MPTQQQLHEQIAHLEQSVKDWRQTLDRPEAMANPIGEGVIRAIGELLGLCQNTEFEQSCWHTVLAVDNFHAAYETWAEEWNGRLQGVSPHGSDRMWYEYQRVLDARNPLPQRNIETPEMLQKQGCNYPQMAKVFGWRLPDGAPDVKKVQEELANPGTHYKAEEMKNPADAQRDREIAEAFHKRCVELQQIQAEQAVREAPEALCDLIAQGNTVRQIQKILGYHDGQDWVFTVSEDDIRAEAEFYGLQIAGEPRPRPITLRQAQQGKEAEKEQQQDESEALANINKHAEISDLEERIVVLHEEEGLRPVEIAKVLEGEYPDLTYQKAGRVLKAWQQTEKA